MVGLSVDNLTDARYFETQNWFDSPARPGEDPGRASTARPAMLAP